MANLSKAARKKMSEGGKARGRKGTAAFSPEKRAEVSRLGVEARRRKHANA